PLRHEGVPDVRRGRQRRSAAPGRTARARHGRGSPPPRRRRAPAPRASRGVRTHETAGGTASGNRRDHAMKIDRTSWGRLRITGGDRERFLQGLTTINVQALAEGAHAWGAILSPKGRVLTVIDITKLGDAFVIACEPSIADKTRALLERYAVMDDVVFEPITGPAHQVWEDAASVWRAPIVEGAGE